MLSPRWRKLAGDVRAAPGRMAVMVVALTVSLLAVTTVLGARTVLTREIRASYLASHPADATLLLPAGVDPSLLAEVRGLPAIAEADARTVIMASARVGAGRSTGLQLFVAEDVAALHLNTVRHESGVWPPPPGTLVLERSAVAVIGAGEGQSLTVETRRGVAASLAIAGTVHDTGLAPAWQEHRGYGYLARSTLPILGEPPVLHDLAVRFRPAPTDTAGAETAAAALAKRLAEGGHIVGEIRVPSLHQHPHEGQMATAQMALLVFSILLLALSGMLVATLLSSMLARQVREIGTMKTLGARSGQVAVLYASLVVAIGAGALALAVPLGALGARAFIDQIGRMMNLALADRSIPAWVFAVVVLTGLIVPLAAAAVPILGACRMTVRAALAQNGARSDFVRPSLLRLPVAARNALRRPGRFALTAGLLAASGTMAITALDVTRGYQRTGELLPAWLHSDLDIVLADPIATGVTRELERIAGVRAVEPWGQSAAVLGPTGSAGSVFVVHTYPDQGHGSFTALAPPADTQMVSYPIAFGRWLKPGDTDAVVLDRIHAGSRGLVVGDRVALSLAGTPSEWTVVGIVDAIPPMSAFVPPATLARLTHTEGRARLFRFAADVTSARDLSVITAAAEKVLLAAGATIEREIPFPLLHAAIDDHLVILTRAAVVLAAIIGFVGLVGLGAALGVSVAERTRELGTMKAVGATDRQVFGLVIGEAVFVGVVSWVAAAASALPVTAVVEGILAGMGFLAPALVVSPSALAVSLGTAVVGSAAASLIPARRAARLTVKEALAEI